MTANLRTRTGFLFSLILSTALLLPGCVSQPQEQTGPSSELQVLVSALVGSYSNADQFEAAPASLKVAPKIGSSQPWVDLQFAAFKSVAAPAIPGEVVALEWRRESPTGPISRQRLWAFREESGAILMDFYSLKAEIDFSSADAFAQLTAEDLISYGDKCALPVQSEGDQYRMSIPDTCKIVSQSGRDMTLSARISIGETLTYEEAGYLSTGDLIFQVPGGRPYLFERASQ